LPDLSFRLNQPVTLFFCFLLPDHIWQSLCNAQNAKWASSMNPLWNKPCQWAANPWIKHTERRRGKKKSQVQSQQLIWWIPRSLKSISCAVHSHHTNIQLFPKSYCNYPNLATSDFCCYKKKGHEGKLEKMKCSPQPTHCQSSIQQRSRWSNQLVNHLLPIINQNRVPKEATNLQIGHYWSSIKTDLQKSNKLANHPLLTINQNRAPKE
jgi:hypothetical protein